LLDLCEANLLLFNKWKGETMSDDLVKRVAELRENAHKAGKEGAGMHRNAGDSGRVGALYMEAAKELDALLALAAFEGGKDE
jgi:hypothetical protein